MADIQITARELIRRAFKTAGILGVGEQPQEEEANDALFTLNEIVDSWNNESMFFSSVKLFEIDMNGDSKYIIPKINNAIQGVFYDYSSTDSRLISNELSIMSITDWQLCDATVSSGVPSRYYYNGEFPYSYINLDTSPVVGKLKVFTTGQFDLFDTLDTIIYLGSGYTRALQYNLAVMLCAEYGRDAPDIVLSKAVSDKALIKVSANSNFDKSVPNDFPGCGRGYHYDIRRG